MSWYFGEIRSCSVIWRKMERFVEDAGVSCLHTWALHWGLRPAGFSSQNTTFPTIALNRRHRPVHIALFLRAICFRDPEKAEIRRISEAEVYMDYNHSALKLSKKHMFLFSGSQSLSSSHPHILFLISCLSKWYQCIPSVQPPFSLTQFFYNIFLIKFLQTR